VAKVPRRHVPNKPATEPKNGKPDEKKLGRTRISLLDQIISDPPQAVNPGLRRRLGLPAPARARNLAMPVDSGAFAMYQSGPVAEKS
jgi:hypothetical protein